MLGLPRGFRGAEPFHLEQGEPEIVDRIQYAHERGLVHLDLKPSNVLLAADGQPMVLDFHLARQPLHPDRSGPQGLGGTAGYMSPEQQAAWRALRQARKVPLPVDGRSDIYSLGVLLYEALGGSLPAQGRQPGSTAKDLAREDLPAPGGKLRPLHRCNPQVSVGLADMVRKCLAADPGDRYPHMAALAADLRRHLADLPLAGVRNRSLAERWRKWRRRRPHGVALVGMLLAVLVAAGAAVAGTVSQYTQRVDQARTALNDGQAQLTRGQWEVAIDTLQRGRSLAGGLPFQGDLVAELDRQRRLAEQARAAAHRTAAVRELHQLTDRLRFLYGATDLPPEGLRGLEACCRAFWHNRGRIVERLNPAGDPAPEPPVPVSVRDDLLDLAIHWADLQVYLAPPAAKEKARRKALEVLAQAEALFGPSPVLDEERKRHGAPASGPAGPPRRWRCRAARPLRPAPRST